MRNKKGTPVDNPSGSKKSSQKARTFVLLGLVLFLVAVLIVLILANVNKNNSPSTSTKNDTEENTLSYAEESENIAKEQSDSETTKEESEAESDYLKNIPFENENQHWAFINLHCGPYEDSEDNRAYYIDKYFSHMSTKERDAIAHYTETDGFGHYYLIIPAHKATVTISEARLNYNNLVDEHGKKVCTVENGIPFSVLMLDPPGDFHPILGLKDSDGRELFVSQNLSGIPGKELEDETILDLTEYPLTEYEY